MVKVKSQAQIQANYKDAAGTAAKRYRAAIPTVTWNAEAQAGQELYEERMRDPEVLARRNKGIAKVSDAAFRSALETKGAGILSTRMSDAAPKMAANFAPYRAALENLSLPPRVADPMVNVDQRLKPVVQAMVDTKKQQG